MRRLLAQVAAGGRALARAPRALTGVLGALAALALLGIWVWAEIALARAAPPALAIAEIEIRPEAADGPLPLTLDARMLGQRAAPADAPVRFTLARDVERGWLIGDLGLGAPIWTERRDGFERAVRRWRLAAGDEIEIGETRLLAADVSPGRLELVVSRRDGVGRARRAEISHFQGRGARAVTRLLDAAGPADRSPLWLEAEACAPLGSVWRSLRDLAAGVDLLARRERVLLSLGGGVDCPDRLALPGAPPAALALTAVGDAVYLAPRADAAGRARMRRAGDDLWTRFAELNAPLDGVARLRIGGATYRPVEEPSGALRLVARDHPARYPLPPSVDAAAAADADLAALCADARAAPGAGPLCDLAALQATAPEGVALRHVETAERARAALRDLRALAGLLTALAIGAALTWVAARAAANRGFARWAPLRPHAAAWGGARLGAVLIGAATALALIAPMITLFGAALPRDIVGPLAVAVWALATFALFRAPERSGALLLFWTLLSALAALGAITGAAAAAQALDTAPLRAETGRAAALAVAFAAAALALTVDLEEPRLALRDAVRGVGRRAALLRAAPLLAGLALTAAWLLAGGASGATPPPLEAAPVLATLALGVAAARAHAARLGADAGPRRLALALGALLVLALLLAPALLSDAPSPLSAALLVAGAVVALGLATIGGALRAERLGRLAEMRARSRAPGVRAARTAGGVIRRRVAAGLGRPWIESVAVALGLGAALVAALLTIAAFDAAGDRADALAAADDAPWRRALAVHLAPDAYPEAAPALRRAATIGAAALGPAADPSPSLSLVSGADAAAALLARWGLLAGVLIGLAQVALVWLLWDRALARYGWSGPGDVFDDASRQPLCLLAAAAGFAFAAHWALSWGAALGALPDTGAQMTWISSDPGHILLLGAPFLVCGLWMFRLTSRRPVRSAGRHGPPPPRLRRSGLRAPAL